MFIHETPYSREQIACHAEEKHLLDGRAVWVAAARFHNCLIIRDGLTRADALNVLHAVIDAKDSCE